MIKPKQREAILVMLAGLVAAYAADLSQRAVHAAPATAPTPRQWPLDRPAPEAVATARERIRGVFKAAYDSAEKPEAAAARAALGRRLLEQAAVDDDDPAERCALLQEAVSLAAAGGDVATAFEAIGRWQLSFGIPNAEAAQAAIAALKSATKATASSAQAADLTHTYILLLEAFSVIGDAANWKDTADAARGVQARLKDPLLDALLARGAPPAGEARPAGAAALQPGLFADVYEDASFNRRLATRLDRQLFFNWNRQSPDPHITGERFSFCWDGYLKAPAAGEYELEITHDDGVVAVLDGKEIVNQWKGGHAVGQAVVKLTGSPQALQVMYNNTSGSAMIHVTWKPPGAAKMVPIPAEAFWHDAAWPWGPVVLMTGVRPADAIAAGSGAASTWFKSYPGPLPWHAAERYCERLGGHLAWIYTREQGDKLREMAGKTQTFIGASDERIERRWEWTNFQRIDPEVFDWGEKRPDGGFGENYLTVRGDVGWIDFSGRHAFICQWDR